MSTVLEACAFCDSQGNFLFAHETWKPWAKGSLGERTGLHGGGREVEEYLVERCTVCRGQGLVQVPTDGDEQAVPCKVCDGGGRQNRDSGEPDDREKPIPCEACYGSGWTGFRPAPA